MYSRRRKINILILLILLTLLHIISIYFMYYIQFSARYFSSCTVIHFTDCIYLVSCQFRTVSNKYVRYLSFIDKIIHYFFQEWTFFFFHSKAEVFFWRVKKHIPSFQKYPGSLYVALFSKKLSFSFIFRKVFNMYLSNFVQSLLSELEEYQLAIAIYNITYYYCWCLQYNCAISWQHYMVCDVLHIFTHKRCTA